MSERSQFTGNITFQFPAVLKEYIPILIHYVQDAKKLDLQMSYSVETDVDGNWEFTIHFKAEQLYLLLQSSMYSALEDLLKTKKSMLDANND